MPAYERQRRLIAAFTLPLLVASLGCGGRLARTLVEPRDHARLDAQAPYLKAHMRDGGVYVLSSWKVDEASRRVQGEGDAFDALRQRTAHGALELGLDDVAIFETNRVQKSPGITALAVITGVSAAVTMACAINPKACFGPVRPSTSATALRSGSRPRGSRAAWRRRSRRATWTPSTGSVLAAAT